MKKKKGKQGGGREGRLRKGKGRKGVGAGHTGIQQETDPEKEERKQYLEQEVWQRE